MSAAGLEQPMISETALRLRLLDAGFSPLPCMGKAPQLKNWQTKFDTNPDEIKLWGKIFQYATNTGILTARTPTFDIDIRDKRGADAVETMVRERLGDREGAFLVRVGRPPKRAVPFQTNEPFKIIQISLTAPDGSTDQKLEFLGDGQQVVVFGIHPDTHQAYHWIGGEPGAIHHDELPHVTEQEARDLVEAAANLLIAEHGYRLNGDYPSAHAVARQVGLGPAGARTEWAELLAGISAGTDLHKNTRNLAAKLVASGMADGAAVNLIRGALENSTAPRDSRFADRMAEVPGEVSSARRKFGKPEAPGPQPSAPGATANAVPGPQPIRFKLIPFEDIRIDTRPAYLVKGIIPRGGLIIIWGPPKCGKSFLAYDLAMHIALGRDYRNRRTRQGAVVYLALEGGSGFAGRVEAWRQRYLNGHPGPVPFYLVNSAIDIIKEHDALIAAIRAQGASAPAAVFIDTLNRGLVGDENKSSDMAQFVRAADAIRTAFDCAVIIVHHCGVAGSRPRGHTSLTGADDAQIAVVRDDDGNMTIEVEHMKDGEPSAPLGARLERVDIGSDDDGETIASCVLVEADPVKKRRKLPAAPQLALDQLHEILADGGEIPPANGHIPPNTRVCTVEVWREAFYRAYPADKQGACQKAFLRACLTLQERKIVGLWSQLAWIAEKTGHSRTFD